MAQIKVYGVESHLNPIKKQLSNAIHSCVVEVLEFPEDKRFHRFFPMKEDNIFYPNTRSRAYTIIEIMMIEGRAVETKKRLIQVLFERIQKEVGIEVPDLEIVMQEAPAYQFGFRGMTGDEILLDYKVEI